MCSKCFDKQYGSFDTQYEFEVFERELILKLNGDLKLFKQSEQYRNIYFDQYECLNCKAIWSLSVPENAWRGFFLNKESLKSHIDKLKKKDKIKIKNSIQYKPQSNKLDL